MATCEDSANEVMSRSRREVTGSAHEPVVSDEGGVTPSEETDHVSPMKVTPTLGEGALGTWSLH
jgi:hypothetical protein